MVCGCVSLVCWVLVLLATSALTLQPPVEDLSVADERSEEVVVVVVVPSALLQVVEGTNHTLTWYCDLPSVTSVTASVHDQVVGAVVSVGEVVAGSQTDNFTYTGNITVSALFIGYNKIYVTLYDDLQVVVGRSVVDMSVLLSYQQLTDLFTLIIGILVSIVYVTMGATLDFQVIKRIFKRPVGPAVGIICQYVFMPLIAFGVSLVAFPGNPLGQLGLFLAGCCPGGGASNLWTHLLGGSLDLSIIMTFVSSVFAFATVPTWVFLLGRVIMGDSHFVIPYKDIALLVVSLSLPCFVGILIQRFLPRVGKVLSRLLTPLAVFNVIFLFTFGVYANRYIFSLFDVKVVVAGLGLPTLGYLSGLILASALSLPLQDVIAISIETGIQNISVAIFILKFSLEKPAGDITAAFPAAAVVMTPVPLVVALLVRRLYLCRRSNKSLHLQHLHKDTPEGGSQAQNPTNEAKVLPQATDKNIATSPEGGVDNPAVDLRVETM